MKAAFFSDVPTVSSKSAWISKETAMLSMSVAGCSVAASVGAAVVGTAASVVGARDVTVVGTAAVLVGSSPATVDVTSGGAVEEAATVVGSEVVVGGIGSPVDKAKRNKMRHFINKFLTLSLID